MSVRFRRRMGDLAAWDKAKLEKSDIDDVDNG